jgi:uncharacterized protein (DUF58 family)
MQSPSLQIDDTLLQSIDDLSLIARHLVNGFLQGHHRSALRGVSQEFVAYRPYMPGDSLKDVDWKVWARSDNLFIRQFRHETNFRGYLFLDASASMDFGSGATNKFAYGRLLAACLASLMLAQMDAPGLALIGGNERPVMLPPSTRPDHIDRIFHQLGTAKADGKSAGLGNLTTFTEDCRQRSLAVVITDGFFDIEEGRKFIEELRFRELDVLVFHLLSPEEMTPDYDGEWVLEDSETGSEMVVDGSQIKRDYEKRLQEFLIGIEDLCNGLEAHYCRIVTDEPLDVALHRYLAQRERL